MMYSGSFIGITLPSVKLNNIDALCAATSGCLDMNKYFSSAMENINPNSIYFFQDADFLWYEYLFISKLIVYSLLLRLIVKGWSS